jgi:glutathione synthase/RimK-type ligase-like ATP-grasp enzyme
MDDLGLEEAIVKPLSGGTASGLSRVRREDAGALQKAASILNGPSMVQPFIPEIATRGETSLIFFAGAFSHAILKTPKAGDIRVQEDHGGRAAPVEAPGWAVDEAARILNLCPEATAYARVDAVLFDDHMVLMEVELVEPELFFVYRPEAADRLAAVLLRHAN